MDWTSLATAFTAWRDACAAERALDEQLSVLYTAIFDHAAGIIYQARAGEALEFDQQALVDLLTAAAPLPNAGLGLARLIAHSITHEYPQAEALARFAPSVGGSYTPEWDRAVLEQMLGALYLRPPEGAISVLSDAPAGPVNPAELPPL